LRNNEDELFFVCTWTVDSDCFVVQRRKSVRIDAQDFKGKKFSLNLKEWQARIFQHEYDHLEVNTTEMRFLRKIPSASLIWL
jgi:peptide deformylase